MLKITHIETTGEAAILRLEGRLIGPWVEELRRSCEGVLSTGATLTLDVSEVSFVAREGVKLLRGLMNRGVTLVNSSPFVTEQLRYGVAMVTPGGHSPREWEGEDDAGRGRVDAG